MTHYLYLIFGVVQIIVKLYKDLFTQKRPPSYFSQILMSEYAQAENTFFSIRNFLIITNLKIFCMSQKSQSKSFNGPVLSGTLYVLYRKSFFRSPESTLFRAVPGPTSSVFEAVPGPKSPVFQVVPGPTSPVFQVVPGPTSAVFQVVPGPTSRPPNYENVDLFKEWFFSQRCP